MTPKLTILPGDCRQTLKTIPEKSVHCVVTSPPYWGLRSYLPAGDPLKALEIGAETTLDEYLANLLAVFGEVWRVLRDDGTLWVNMGDGYNGYFANQRGTGLETQRQESRPYFEPGTGLRHIGLKPKDLIGQPWRLAFALQEAGWYLRSDIIWNKPACMPESVTDRPTKSHEYLFMFAKQPKYFYDAEAVKEQANPNYASRYNYDFNVGAKETVGGGRPNGESNTPGLKAFTGTRNLRDVWTIPSEPFRGAHYATFPTALVKPCILAGTSARGVCAKCGAPWERVVKIGNPDKETTRGNQSWARETGQRDSAGGLPMRKTETIGWQPTCQCDCHDTVPATCLDPFGGSGTVGQVALELGRSAILCELNPAYIEQQNQRTAVTLGLAL